MRREYINEVAWGKILRFLINCKGIYMVSEMRLRNFLEAIFWMARTGAQWRELPSEYGKWNSVYHRFNAWSKKKIWDQLLEFCSQDPDLEYIMMDATIVRAHACAAGYGNQDEEGLGRSKGGFTTKIHAKVDALGNPLKIIITPGQRHDVTQASALLNGVANAKVIADKGYACAVIRDQIIKQFCEPVIPPRANALIPWAYDDYFYKERHLIECFFSKIKHFRRIFSRFDKSLRNYASFVAFASAMIWLR